MTDTAYTGNILSELEYLVTRDLLTGLVLTAFAVSVLNLDYTSAALLFAVHALAGTFIHQWVREDAIAQLRHK